jgi:transposase
LRVLQTRDHLSVMSGVTLAGQMATLLRTRALTGHDSIRFLQHLATSWGGKMLVIWDGATIHRSQAVKEFLADGWGKAIHLERFPAYAPDLNPDEWAWQHLKHVELRNYCCFDFEHLSSELHLAIRRVRRRPDLIQSFFRGARLEC